MPVPTSSLDRQCLAPYGHDILLLLRFPYCRALLRVFKASSPRCALHLRSNGGVVLLGPSGASAPKGTGANNSNRRCGNLLLAGAKSRARKQHREQQQRPGSAPVVGRPVEREQPR